jgi:valyl-tRNA synthetase
VEQKQLTGRTMLSVPDYNLQEKFEFGMIVSFKYAIEGSGTIVSVFFELGQD